MVRGGVHVSRWWWTGWGGGRLAGSCWLTAHKLWVTGTDVSSLFSYYTGEASLTRRPFDIPRIPETFYVVHF